MACDVGSTPVIANFVLPHAQPDLFLNTEVNTSHSYLVSELSSCIIRARELVLLYKWVGWIRLSLLLLLHNKTRIYSLWIFFEVDVVNVHEIIYSPFGLF